MKYMGPRESLLPGPDFPIHGPENNNYRFWVEFIQIYREQI